MAPQSEGSVQPEETAAVGRGAGMLPPHPKGAPGVATKRIAEEYPQPQQEDEDANGNAGGGASRRSIPPSSNVYFDSSQQSGMRPQK